MLSGMGRNEEEDRYTAALAITQLSEVLRVQDDGSNASAKFDMKDKVENIKDGFDNKPTVFIDGLKLNDSPPLDLTLKKKPNISESSNILYSKRSVPKSCAGFVQNVTKQEQNIYQCDDTNSEHGLFSNIIPSTKSSNNLIGRNLFQREPFSISNNLNAILIQQPVLGVISVGTNDSFLSPKIAVPENNDETGVRGFDSCVSNIHSFCKREKAFSLSGDDVIKFVPRGLSSLSNYYRSIGVEKLKLVEEQIHFDQRHHLRSGNIVCTKIPQPNFTEFRMQNKIPTGLSSITEYYHKGQFLNKLKHKALDHTEQTPRYPAKRSFPVVPLPVAEVSNGESSGSGRNIHKPLKPHKRKTIKIKSPAETQAFSQPFSTPTFEEDFLGKPLKRSTGWSSDTSHDLQNKAELKIPLKVLELSLADDSAVSESKSTTIPSSIDDSRVKGVTNGKTRLDFKKVKPLEIKREAEVMCDFLNPDEDGDYIIHIAASQGDVEHMKQYLQLMRDQGGDINCRDVFRQTPLHIAIEMNNLSILSCLLEAGANPCLPDIRGQTCLHLAILHNNIQALGIMLQHSTGFNCNTMNYEGLTALHLAVLKNQIESVNLLISSGLVDINAKEGKSGKTALYLSAEHNKTAILFTLLACGASDKETDYSGYTPYQAATTKQNKEIISIFDEQKKDKLQT